eukprot:7876610-Pyramimonas_sp.AAC.3
MCPAGPSKAACVGAFSRSGGPRVAHLTVKLFYQAPIACAEQVSARSRHQLRARSGDLRTCSAASKVDGCPHKYCTTRTNMRL